jgi:hypothetical protein
MDFRLWCFRSCSWQSLSYPYPVPSQSIPHNITLANGSKVQVTDIGPASPLPSLSLNYVLFLPGSPFNLSVIFIFIIIYDLLESLEL